MVRRILVTGGNRGIGLAIVKRCLVDHGDTHVILGCRSLERGRSASASLVASNPQWEARLTVLELDTASDLSVQAAAASVQSQHGKDPPPLYAIVNNVGIAAGTVCDVINVNVRGPKRTDDAFLPLLDPGSGRIVQMSSGAASDCVSKSSEERQAFFTDAEITWEQIDDLLSEVEAYPNGAKDLSRHGLGGTMGVYGLSKALLNSYTMLRARQHPNLKVNACTPGMIATDIIGSILPWWVPIPNCIVRWLAAKVAGAKTPDEGTVSAMHLLFHDKLEGNGRYYGSDAKRSPLDKSRSPDSPAFEGPQGI